MNLQKVKLIEKLAKDINRWFYRKRDPFRLNKNMKKFLTSPVIREMQVETLVRDISYIYIVIKIKSLKISGIGQKME